MAGCIIIQYTKEIFGVFFSYIFNHSGLEYFAYNIAFFLFLSYQIEKLIGKKFIYSCYLARLFFLLPLSILIKVKNYIYLLAYQVFYLPCYLHIFFKNSYKHVLALSIASIIFMVIFIVPDIFDSSVSILSHIVGMFVGILTITIYLNLKDYFKNEKIIFVYFFN